MPLTAEQKVELDRFPVELRSLIDAELAIGNTIEEVGHSHPAPPAGAYFKLTKKVSTRPHAASPGITFRERNSSISSGEFGDPTGFFFVVEPPNPPPEPIDMDAIRKSLEPKPDPTVRPGQRSPGKYKRPVRVERPDQRTVVPLHARPEDIEWRDPHIDEIIAHEKDAGVTHEFLACDNRSPELMQAAMERELMMLFDRSIENGTLVYRTNGNVNGVRYTVEMEYCGATHGSHFYRLKSDASWSHFQKKDHEYFRTTSNGWFKMWMRELTGGGMNAAEEEKARSTTQYLEACERAMQFESQLDSVESLQKEIVAGMKKGGRFSTSHKEGGTNIRYRNGTYVRDDYGDDPNHIAYKDQADFLAKLKMFMHWDVARHFEGQKITELQAWKLILRSMRTD